ncbi:nucleobase-ascorbate transporter 4-like [Vigna radiata var. radiata]|uniref:Nucleobase-ascorbate transporter 4-like n=1 Tax=Vigna radiata var. radiata TaxID=3916 RepID=A0A3Q0ES85_VIGRR|nr:nucleobase-ascorbate transporter 4-like [Vigna radiata var. radiata]
MMRPNLAFGVVAAARGLFPRSANICLEHALGRRGRRVYMLIHIRFLSPLSVAPLVTLTELGLFMLGFPKLADCVEIGLPALLIIIILSQYIPQRMKSRGADRFAVMVSIGIVWAFAEILTAAGAYNKRSPRTQLSCRTDRSGLISAAPWIRVPYPFQWERPSFNAGDAFAVIAASLVAIVETVKWDIHCSIKIWQCNPCSTFCAQSWCWLAGHWHSFGRRGRTATEGG